MKKVEAPAYILFDWDGVLADTHEVIGQAFQEILVKMGHPPKSEEELKNLPAMSLRNYFPKLFGERASEATELFYNYIYTYHLKYFKLMPGAQELVESIHRLNIPMSVISNKIGPVLRREVEHLGWNSYFYKVIGSKDCPEDKPSPVVVEEALNGLPIKARSHVWFIGDTAIDMECAHRSELISILLHKNASGIPRQYAPSLSFSTCKDLQKYLHQVYSATNNKEDKND
jgi:phosphoglycolate phosphatase